jgi:hypothetical protein
VKVFSFRFVLLRCKIVCGFWLTKDEDVTMKALEVGESQRNGE